MEFRYFKTFPPDVIAVSETRIHDGNFTPGKHYITGYQKLIYDPAPTNGTPGGAGIFDQFSTFCLRKMSRLRQGLILISYLILVRNNLKHYSTYLTNHILTPIYFSQVWCRNPCSSHPGTSGPTV